MSTPRYLVTGGDGFIGSHLVRRLASRGEVTVIVEPSCEIVRLQEFRRDIELCWLDVRDQAGIGKLIRTVRPTVVFHLAGAGLVPGKEPPAEIMAVNVGGAYNILAGILASETVERAVFVGSWYEYGRGLTENSRRFPQPMSVYGVSKLAASRLVQSFAMEMNVPAILVRPFQVYGPWEGPHRLVPQVVRAVRSGMPLQLHNPQSRRDWVYVEDVAAALDVVGKSECRGQVVDIGTGVMTSVAAVVSMLCEVMGVRGQGGDRPVAHEQGGSADFGDQSLSGAAETYLAKAMLGWEAEHDLREGLRKTVEWYLEQEGP